jgi:hypothetical protein
MTACNLMRKKESFGIAAFAAEFERPKILIPWTFGHLWLRFHPNPQLIQVIEIDVAIVHAIDQMVTNAGGKP